MIPDFPFVGVIEHTNLDQADASGRRRYRLSFALLAASDPMFGASTTTSSTSRCRIFSECFRISTQNA